MENQNTTPQTINNFKLINIENYPSRNGFSMLATLLMNGEVVCRMDDKGDGSQPDFDKINQPLFNQLQTAIAQMPPQYDADLDYEFKIDMCMFIDLLHYAQVNKTEFTLLN